MLAQPQYVPVFGGVAGWYIPAVAAVLGLGAVGLGLLDVALALAALGGVADTAVRGMVVELSQVGITHGFRLNSRFLGRTTVMAWGAIVSVHTDWRNPGDDTALATTVRDGDGHAIHFTTAMGLRAYWACLSAVAANVPAARHSGLTQALLSAEPPGRQHAISVAATAATLGLILMAFVAVHYVWSQGRSSLSRSVEAAGTMLPPGGGSVPAAPGAGR